MGSSIFTESTIDAEDFERDGFERRISTYSFHAENLEDPSSDAALGGEPLHSFHHGDAKAPESPRGHSHGWGLHRSSSAGAGDGRPSSTHSWWSFERKGMGRGWHIMKTKKSKRDPHPAKELRRSSHSEAAEFAAKWRAEHTPTRSSEDLSPSSGPSMTDSDLTRTRSSSPSSTSPASSRIHSRKSSTISQMSGTGVRGFRKVLALLPGGKRPSA